MTDAAAHALAIGALSFGAPLLLAVLDLWRTPRGGGGSGPEPEPDPVPSPLSPGGAHRPLPDCLIPKPVHARSAPRELVDA